MKRLIGLLLLAACASDEEITELPEDHRIVQPQTINMVCIPNKESNYIPTVEQLEHEDCSVPSTGKLEDWDQETQTRVKLCWEKYVKGKVLVK